MRKIECFKKIRLWVFGILLIENFIVDIRLYIVIMVNRYFDFFLCM